MGSSPMIWGFEKVGLLPFYGRTDTRLKPEACCTFLRNARNGFTKLLFGCKCAAFDPPHFKVHRSPLPSYICPLIKTALW
jgi:hypothetical protein